jgi:hypothetical protein
MAGERLGSVTDLVSAFPMPVTQAEPPISIREEARDGTFRL